MFDPAMDRVRRELDLEPLGLVDDAMESVPHEQLEMQAAAGDLPSIYALALAAQTDNQMLVAERWWLLAARQDDAAAMHNLGNLAFESGDVAGAARWWEAAAERSCRPAEGNLYVIQREVGPQ